MKGFRYFISCLFSIDYSGKALAGNSVSKTEFERAIYQSKVDVTHLRSEVHLLEKNEFSILKAEIFRLASEASKIPNKVGEESKRVASNVRVELYLDKARISDEQTRQELKIKEALSKIDSEVSQFKLGLETVQWDLFRTIFPLICAGGALFFSYLRFLK